MKFNTIGLKINQMIHKNEKNKYNMCPNIEQFCILYFVNKCIIAWNNMDIDLYGNKVEKGYNAKVILHTNVDKLKAIGCVKAI